MNYVSDINDSTIFNVSSTLDAAQVEMHRPWSCAVCVFESPGMPEDPPTPFVSTLTVGEIKGPLSQPVTL